MLVRGTLLLVLVLVLILAWGFAAPVRAEDEAPAERALELHAEGAAAFEQRDYAKALSLFEQAQEEHEAAGLQVEAAWDLAWRGRCLQRLRRHDEALSTRAAALDRFREIHGENDHFDVALNLNAVASAHRALGQTQETVELQQLGLEMLRRLIDGDDPEVARSIGNLARSLDEAGRSRDALALHEECLGMRERLYSADHEQVARAVANKALCLDELGRSDEALPLHRRALETRERLYDDDHPSKCYSLNNLARCLRFLGRTRDAFETYRRSLKMRERLYPENHPTLAIALDNLGRCLRAMGRPADALLHHERAYEINRKAFRRPHPYTARSASFLGSCMRDLGLVEDALAFHQVALDMRRTVYRGDHPGLASSLSNTASCLVGLERVAQAEGLYRESLEMCRRIWPEGSSQVATCMGNLSGCLGRLGRLEAAHDLAKASLDMLRDIHGEDHPRVGAAWQQYGGSLYALRRDDQAGRAYRRSVEIARAHQDPQAHLATVDLARLLLLRQGRPEEAIEFLNECITQIEALRQDARGLERSGQAAYFQHLKRFGAYDLMVQAQIDVGRPAEALLYAERGRARAFLDLLEGSRFDPFEAALRRARLRGDDETVAKLSEIQKDRSQWLAEVLRRERISDAMAGMQGGTLREMRRASKQLADARRSYEAASRKRSLMIRDLYPMARSETPATLQRRLTGAERMLVYTIGAEQAFLIVVPPAGRKVQAVRMSWPDGTDVSLGGLATQVSAHLTSITSRDESHLETGERLWHALVPKEVRQDLLAASRVYLVPHGPLHRLPFETLVLDRAKKRYWLDDGPALVYAPSGSVLERCRRRADEQWDEKLPYAVVALGDPVFQRSPTTETPVPADRPGISLLRAGPLLPIPGTRREVESIRDSIDAEREGKVLVLLGEDATKTRLRAEASKAAILHLATHQQVDEREGGGFSRLAFTVPEVPTPSDDGFLRLQEMFEDWRDRLSACRLVVLSACETQQGPLQKDEGVYAMTLGFIYAGCPSAVGSLWRVDDESTADLMSGFYRRLQEGQAKLDAFTAARKALRASYPKPFHWAPFVYVGDPR